MENEYNHMITIKQFVLLLCMLVGFIACNTNNEIKEDIPIPAKPRFVGSFLQDWLTIGWDEARWIQEMEMMKEAGMEYLIYTNALTIDENGVETYNYPSQYASSNARVFDVFESCLRNAQRYGIKVVIGLNFNDRWWKGNLDTAWLIEQMKQGNKIADELVARYKMQYPDAFWGW